MKLIIKNIFFVFLLLFSINGFSQTINVNTVTRTGLFATCTNSIPTVTINYVSGTGTSVVGGSLVCNDPCGTTTLHIVISNIKWQQLNAEWIHGIFFPVNAGYTVSGIAIPPGFITYNGGCTGMCTAVGITAGPGFYFDNSSSSSCCGSPTANDGLPCNNWGDASLGCSTSFSLNFNLTFCNSTLTTATETFTLRGTSDGGTGCYNINNFASHTVAFTINTTPCSPVFNTNPSASTPIRSCVGNSISYTSTLTGGCGNGSTISWYDAAVGGNLVGQGSPFNYTLANGACPSGSTLYSSCCPLGSTTCVSRTAVLIPGVCDTMSIIGVTKTANTCANAGSITNVNLLNAQGIVNYNLMPSNITNTTGQFSNLTLPSYTVTATDAGNCSVSTIVVFDTLPNVSLSFSSIVNPTCALPLSGSFVANGSGGNTPYTYSISPNSTQSSAGVFSGLSSQIYTVILSDSNSCKDTSTVQLVTPNGPIFSTPTIQNVSCNLGTNGAITQIATGGNGTINYNLQPTNQNNTTGIFTNLSANTYTVKATDGNGCSITTQIIISQPTQIVFNTPTQLNVSCINGNNGQITQTVTGGTGTISYTIQPTNQTNTTGIFTNLNANNYTITATDLNNCSITTQINISEPTQLVFNNLTQLNVSCNGGNNGSLTQIATGGTGIISYNIQPTNQTNTTGIFTNLVANNYTITATDSNNCSITTTINITEPSQLLITNISNTAPTCVPGNDGTITVTANGGTPIYQYNNGGVNQNSNIITNVGAGNYTITVTDNKGCTATGTTILVTPNGPIFSTPTIQNVSCDLGNNGSITQLATGGNGTINYNLQPTNQNNTTGIFTNLSANTYTVKATDGNGCSITTQIIISQPTQIVFNTPTQLNVSCINGNNGQITQTVTGGTGTISYTIQPTNQTNTTGIFTNLNANNYTITATDLNNCSITTQINISEPTQLVFNNLTQLNVSCNGGNNGSLTQIATGGTGIISYNIQPTNQTNTTGIFTNLVANNYTITATDSNNCSITTTINITEPSQLLITNISNTAPTCVPGNDGTITVTANGGTPIYQYNNGGVNQNSNIITNVGAGNYTITVTDNKGCTATGTTILVTPNGPIFSTPTIQNVSCDLGNNGSITQLATGGNGTINYNLQPTNQNNTTGIFTNLSANTYTVKATDGNGCSITTQIIISQPTQIVFNTPTQLNVSCINGNNGQITQTVTGGTGTISYTIQPTNQTNTTGIFTNLNANNYTITATDLNNCSITTQINISEPTQLVFNNLTQLNVSCNGGNNGSLTQIATGGTGIISYNIQPTNQTNTTGIFTNLVANNYTITATDSNNCSITTTINITEPSQLLITNISNTAPTCVPGNDGTITVTANGGTPIYQYNNGGVNQNSNIITNVGAGNYTITVTDNKGCTATGTTILVTPNGPIFSTPTIQNVSCDLGNNGSITQLATGGNGTINYNLQPTNQNNTTGIFTNLSANTYTVKATDGNGCSITTQIIISQPTQIVFNTPTQLNVSCINGNNGQITQTVTGGTGTISYTIQPTNQTNTTGIFTNLNANNYTITATDLNNCSITTQINISEPTQLVFNNLTQLNVSCNGGNNGSLTQIATGGTGIISYNIQPTNQTNTTGIFTNLVANNYTITATDSNNCSITTTINITEPSQLLITNISNTAPTCVPGNDGTITVTANGGTPIYQYNNGGVNQNSNIITNVGAGNYTITVTDNKGCTATGTTILVTPNSPNIISVMTTTASCIPGNDGTVTITANNGIAPYTYSKNGISFQNSNVIIGLANTNYTIVVKDANGCTGTSVIQIVNPQTPTIDSVTTTKTTCSLSCDGTATISASSTNSIVSSYSIDGINFQNSNIFSSLCPNNYTIIVKDANGCTTSSIITILPGNAPNITNLITTNVLCNGNSTGVIQTQISGGVGILNYTIQPINTNNNSGNFNNLPANNYTITVSDINGCSSVSTTSISQPQLLQFGNVVFSGSLCNGGSNGVIDAPTIGGTGSITYSILPNANFIAPSSFNNLNGNITYTIMATDANNCSVSTTIFIAQPNAITINNFVVNNITCNNANDGTLMLLATGGTGMLTYNITPNNQSNTSGNFTNLIAGNYTVSVVDANNCSITSTFSIINPQPIILDTIFSSNVVCNNQSNGMITIVCSGGIGNLSYNLQPTNTNNATGIFNNLSANNYTIICTDANACSYSTTAFIENPLPLVFDSVNATNILCAGNTNGTISAYASGGNGSVYTYSITPQNSNNSTGFFNNLSANNFTITVIDIKGCSNSQTKQIIEPLPINLTIDSTKNNKCFGENAGSIFCHAINGTPNYSYTLLPNNINNNLGEFNNLSANSYSIIVTDINGCSTSINNINITQPNPLIINSVSKVDILCNGANTGEINMSVNGGTGIINYSISSNPNLNNVSGLFTNLFAGNYIVTAKDANNCSISTTVVLNQNPAIIFTEIEIKNPSCFGDANGTIKIVANGGVGTLKYQINNGPSLLVGNYLGLTAGNYLITITDDNNCKKDTIITIVEPAPVYFSTLDIFPVYCYGESNGSLKVQGFGGTGNYTYYIRPGLHFNQNGNFYNLHEGIYTLTIKDGNECHFDTTFTISPSLNPLKTSITKQDLGCYGKGVEGWANANVSGGEAPYTIEWSTKPPQTTEKAEGLVYGYYFVDIVDAKGCNLKDTVYINPGTCCEEVFIPNAFTPNGDGTNDIFRVTTSAGIELIQFAVYDRWGNKLWSTNDFRKGWDGKYRGMQESLNTFYYIFSYKCMTDGNNYIKKGDVTIIQ